MIITITPTTATTISTSVTTPTISPTILAYITILSATIMTHWSTKTTYMSPMTLSTTS